MRNLRQNLAIALATVALLVTGVLAGGVTMALGMLVHQVSVRVVIANGMRLLRIPAASLETGRAPTVGQPVASLDELLPQARPVPAGSR